MLVLAWEVQVIGKSITGAGGGVGWWAGGQLKFAANSGTGHAPVALKKKRKSFCFAF